MGSRPSSATMTPRKRRPTSDRGPRSRACSSPTAGDRAGRPHRLRARTAGPHRQGSRRLGIRHRAQPGRREGLEGGVRQLPRVCRSARVHRKPGPRNTQVPPHLKSCRRGRIRRPTPWTLCSRRSRARSIGSRRRTACTRCSKAAVRLGAIVWCTKHARISISFGASRSRIINRENDGTCYAQEGSMARFRGELGAPDFPADQNAAGGAPRRSIPCPTPTAK